MVKASMDQTAFLTQSRTKVLLTAAEAFPALERAFLSAREEIWASFLVFDLTTELRSEEARKVGRTWFDLMVHTLRRGVAVTMILSDFDPIIRSDFHRMSWRSCRLFQAAAEVAGQGAKLTMKVALHSSETGLLPRMAIWPGVMQRLRKFVRELNAIPVEKRRAKFRDMPGIHHLVDEQPDGRLFVRHGRMPRLYPGVHHQKLAVFDRTQLYIGGLDLDERRYDTPNHNRPGSETWHDVQLMTEGPVVAEAQEHLEQFLDVVARRREPAPQRLLLRTLSRRRSFELPFFGPEPVLQEIVRAHEALAGMTDRLIYMESQYFRDRAFARKLANLAQRNPG